MTAQEKLALVNRTLARAGSSAFYRDRLPAEPLRSLDEIAALPLTTKEDLRRASPFGLVCVERHDLYQYHESFGTTGTPVPAWYTREDVRENAEALARLGVGFRPEDVVLVRFPYAISAIAHLIHAGAQLAGACVIPASSRTPVTPFRRVVELLRKLEVTVMACLPLQAVLIAETAEMLGLMPERDFPALRAICTAGEPLPPGRRHLLEEIWGVPVFDNYGLTETGVLAMDCEYGRCHPREESFLFEVLSPDLTGPVSPGGVGMLVVTTLHREAMPLVRYLTGDRAALTEEDCACGRRLVLLMRGRAEHTVEAGGRIFDLWDLDAIASRLPSHRYWAVGPVSGGLRFVVEDEGGGGAVIKDPELSAEFGIGIEVETVPRGTLHDRAALLSVGEVGKPRYLYTAEEMERRVYARVDRV